MKRLTVVSCFVLALLMVFSLGVLAHSSRKPLEEPTPGIAPDNGYAEEPGGINFEYVVPGQDHRNDSDFSTNHFSLTAHVHYVDDIYDTYDGYRDRGEVASGYNGKSTSDTLSFQITRTVSNNWSTSIGFSDNVVSAEVGYDVTWSTSKSWTYSATVTAGYTAHIGYQDWYHVQKYNCHTLWSYGYGVIDTEYGTGWAEQWYKPHFYSWETPGNSA